MTFLEEIKKILKPLVKKSPIPLTKGQRMDFLSARIIKQYCRSNFNTIDVGAHSGEILDLLIDASPNGLHFAFEPLPHLFEGLRKNYGDQPNVHLFPCALSDQSGRSIFQYVVSNPAYSGLKKRRYDRKNEEVTQIEVDVRTMDDCIPQDQSIQFIKIDVEGAELFTLKGAERILDAHHPMILFEHGRGGADSYGYGAPEIWKYLCAQHNYHIHTLSGYLNNQSPLSEEGLNDHFIKGDEFYFVAV